MVFIIRQIVFIWMMTGWNFSGWNIINLSSTWLFISWHFIWNVYVFGLSHPVSLAEREVL